MPKTHHRSRPKAATCADRTPASSKTDTNGAMGSEIVDQIGPDGALIQDVDTTLSPTRKRELLFDALPGARIESYAGRWVVRFQDQVILTKQVTHLGRPWEAYKKRIQIPRYWLDIEQQGRIDGLTVRFVGVYHYGGTTIFVDFDPTTYVKRKANNSAAHVSTNDLFQAQTLGQFSREDKNGNRLTSVRADQFATYLLAGYEEKNPHIDVFDRFSEAFLDGARIDGLAAVQEMHAANWPDKFQNEWAGFYVEFRLSRYRHAARTSTTSSWSRRRSARASSTTTCGSSSDGATRALRRPQGLEHRRRRLTGQRRRRLLPLPRGDGPLLVRHLRARDLARPRQRRPRRRSRGTSGAGRSGTSGGARSTTRSPTPGGSRRRCGSSA